MILDLAEAREAAAMRICAARSDNWDDEDDWQCATSDAAAALEAVGFEELVASRERAIRYAVRFESEVALTETAIDR